MTIEDVDARRGDQSAPEESPLDSLEERNRATDAPVEPHASREINAEQPYPTIYSAPRRFDLAMLLAVTVAYALLFTMMRLLRAPPHVFALIAGFFTAVAFGQALLFRGEAPRKASVLVGAVYWTGALLLQFEWHPCAAIGSAIQGGLLGYVAGTLVGGVFLVADALRRAAS